MRLTVVIVCEAGRCHLDKCLSETNIACQCAVHDESVLYSESCNKEYIYESVATVG